MGAPQGEDPKGLQHQVDTLKRVVLFDDYVINVLTANSGPMGAPVQLDISSYVSATAIAGIFTLTLRPTANAYWELFTQTDLSAGTRIHLTVFAGSINQFRSSYGIQPIAPDKTLYYQSVRLAGGGNATWVLTLHGYIDKA